MQQLPAPKLQEICHPYRQSSRKKPTKKRSKTYTGCSTCRERSVKCGEQKQTCLRCRKSGIHCAGYAVGLVWPGDKGSRTQHRHMIEPALSRRAILGKSAVDAALANIDAQQNSNTTLHIDLFSVFPLHSISPAPEPASSQLGEGFLLDENDVQGDKIDASILQAEEIANEQVPEHYASSVERQREAPTVDEMLGLSWPTMKSIPTELDPFYITSKRERLLKYHWYSFLSGITTPFPRPDNAFKDIITPMALTAVDLNSDSEGHLALLHALYTITAASRPALCPNENQVDRGHTSSPFGKKRTALAQGVVCHRTDTHGAHWVEQERQHSSEAT